MKHLHRQSTRKTLRATNALATSLTTLALVVPTAVIAEPAYSDNTRELQQHSRDAELNYQDKSTRLHDSQSDSETAPEFPAESRSDMNDVRAVIASALEAAMDADLENVVDHLSNADRERIAKQKEVPTEDLQQTARSFRESFEARTNTDVDEAFSANNVRVRFLQGVPEKSALVEVSSGSERVKLNVVNEGTIMDSWKIQAPATVSRQSLKTSIQQALGDAGRTTDRQKIATNVLKGLGQS